MELYLFRHGIAEDAKPGSPDAERALTGEGRRKVADVVRAARRAGVEPSLILSSPYRRAMETARIAADEFAWKGDIIRSNALTPAKSPEEVWTELRDYRKEPAVLLASHEPLLGRLVAHLLFSPALRVEMKKAAMVRIDVENSGPVPHGTLCWMLTPKLCP